MEALPTVSQEDINRVIEAAERIEDMMADMTWSSPLRKWDLDSVQTLKRWLGSDQAKTAIENLGGYETNRTGDVNRVT